MFPDPHGRFVRWATRLLPVVLVAPLLLIAAFWGLSDEFSLTGASAKHGRLSPGSAPSSSAPTLPEPSPSPCDINGCQITSPDVTDAYARAHLLTFAELRANADIRYELKASETNLAPPRSYDRVPACDWSQRPLRSNYRPGHSTFYRQYQSWWWQYPQWASTPKSAPPRYRYIQVVTTYTDRTQQESDWAAIAAYKCQRPATTKFSSLAGWQWIRRYQTIHCLNIHWDTDYCSSYDDYFRRGNVTLALEWSEAPDNRHHAQHTADRLDTLILRKFNQEMP